MSEESVVKDEYEPSEQLSLLWTILGGAILGAVVALVVSQGDTTVNIEVKPDQPASTG